MCENLYTASHSLFLFAKNSSSKDGFGRLNFFVENGFFSTKKYLTRKKYNLLFYGSKSSSCLTDLSMFKTLKILPPSKP